MNIEDTEKYFNDAKQTTGLVTLVTTKPDTEVAADLKAELIEAAKPWLEACTKAHKAGFVVTANFGPNYLGQYTIQAMGLSKHY